MASGRPSDHLRGSLKGFQCQSQSPQTSFVATAPARFTIGQSGYANLYRSWLAENEDTNALAQQAMVRWGQHDMAAEMQHLPDWRLVQ